MEKLAAADEMDWKLGVETWLRVEQNVVDLTKISPERDEALKACFAFFNGLDPEKRALTIQQAVDMAKTEQQNDPGYAGAGHNPPGQMEG